MNSFNDPKVLIQVDETEDTEWNDILRQHGVIPERPPSPMTQLEDALEDTLRKQQDNRLEDKNLSELEELEDEEDEAFFEFYKQKRIAEIKKMQEKAKFGQVFHVSKHEYNEEITRCSKGEDDGNKVYVFVHLSSEGKLQSRLLSALFQQAALKFPDLKFVEIPANRAIEEYPESNIPTLLVYYGGDVLEKFITLLELGGNSTTLADLENLIVKVGAVDVKDHRLLVNRDSEEDVEQKKLGSVNKTIGSGFSSRFDR